MRSNATRLTRRFRTRRLGVWDNRRVDLAWWFSRYADEQSAENRGRYKSEEEETRLRKRGLWMDDAPVPPWEWWRR